MAREALGTGEDIPDVSATGSCRGGFHEPSRVRLGDMNRETEEKLAELDRHTLELGRIFGTCYIGESLRVLVLEGVVELVEYPVSKPMPLSEINSKYGRPCRMFVSPSGVKTLVYEDFAVDVRDDLITGVILFEKGRS